MNSYYNLVPTHVLIKETTEFDFVSHPQYHVLLVCIVSENGACGGCFIGLDESVVVVFQ